MKKILLSLIVLISLKSFAQDSSRLKPSVTLKAKDFCFIMVYINEQRRYEDLDSAINSKYRGGVIIPDDGDNVIVGGVENRVWLSLAKSFAVNILALQTINGNSKRLNDALTATGQTWLIRNIANDASQYDTQAKEVIKAGKKLAKKELNEDF